MKFRHLIPEYPIGSDLVVLNTNFHYGQKTDDGRRTKDSMTIMYRDNETGEKHFSIIPDPEYAFYMTKQGLPTPEYRKFFEEEKNLELVTCRYRDLYKAIASNLGPDALALYNKNIKSGNGRENRNFQKSLRLFGSDIAINDFYRMRFAEQYQNTETSVSRAYLDIEVDNTLSDTAFPTNGNCPINAISYMNHDKKELTTFLLDQTEVNPLIQQFSDTFDNTAFNIEFHEFLREALGGQERVEHFKLEGLKTRVIMYQDELTMITDLFRYINYEQPDFLMAWNMAFDIPFIIDRLKVLGADPKEIICNPEFPDDYKFCKYIIDERSQEFSEKGDYADISSYTIYIDQLIQFASRRKGGAKYRSYSLDSIGNEVAGVRKLNYEDIASSILDLPYKDYRTFVKYNMMDVLVQYCIEFKSDDIPYIFNKSLLNCTDYRKIHRQTVYLANRAVTMFKEFGDYILGNNLNKYADHSNDEKYEGAFVADPNKFADDNKDTINGRPIMRASNAVDFDFTRLYPSIIQEYNMAPNTLIGYIRILDKVYEGENSINNPKYTRSGQFIEDMTSENPLEFMHRWFRLANFQEAYLDIIEYFHTKEIPFYEVEDTIYNTTYTDMDKEKMKINIVYFGNKDITYPDALSVNEKDQLDILFRRNLLL